MSVYVFLGPSLALQEARSVFPAATFLPPVAQGDVQQLLSAQPRAIGIIDGYFENIPSVWHKEILQALSQGVSVFGAASMGALRAVELDVFGMQGVGLVYQWYRDGRIEDDDEVAVTHAPAEMGYKSHSDAMVDIRFHYEAACRRGVINTSERDALLSIAKSLYFPLRSFDRVLELGLEQGIDSAVAQKLQAFVKANGAGIKARDARLLLQTMVAERGSPQPPQSFVVEQTVFMNMLQQEVAVRPPIFGQSEIADNSPELLEKRLFRFLLRREADRLGIVLQPHHIQDQADSFRRQHGLESVQSMQQWLEQRHMDLTAFTEFICDECLLERVRHHYRFRLIEDFGAYYPFGDVSVGDME